VLAGPAWADPSSTSPEQGYDLGQIQTPRSVAMGGAQTALGNSTIALFENPANLPLSRVYHFEALAAIAPEPRRQSYGGAVADSATNRLAGGFGGTWNQLDPDGIHRTWTDLRLTLAYPFADRFSIGATGRYLRVSQGTATGPFGSSFASDGTSGDPIVNNFTFDLGATLIPANGFYLGAVGHNLTNPGTGLAPTTLTGGIGYSQETFSLEGDVLADFTTYTKVRPRIMIGGELFASNRFPIRLGYRYDDGTHAHAVSGGLGYVDKKFSFEISVRRDVVADHPMTLFSAGLRYFYESAKMSVDEPDSF
jgi:hypothetical protein